MTKTTGTFIIDTRAVWGDRMKKFDAAVYKKRKCECLDKCFQAFMDNGLENTGLQLLCKYCGFKTNQALYHYFESKDMIITESVQYAMIKFFKIIF